jgi:hypothetical protein
MTDDDRIKLESSRQSPSALRADEHPRDDRMGAHRSHAAWTAWRRMRWAWWTLTTVFVAALVFDASAEISLGLGMFWGVLSLAAAYWPCPHCGKHVGVAGRFPVFLSPFGGWCLACNRRLFGSRSAHDA